MAAVLELALDKQIPPASVIKWLKDKEYKGEVQALKDLERVKPDFIPFFLNYLRDQSSSLLQGCRSTNQSPAKTPASMKINRKTKAPVKSHSTPASTSHTSSTSRTLKFTNSSPQDQVPVLPLPPKRDFATPSASELSDTSFGFATPETSRDKSVSFNWSAGGGGSGVRSGGGSGQRKHRSSPVVDMSFSGGGSRQSWSNMLQTPDTGPRSKHRTSLADFFMSPENDHRKRRSPNTSQGQQGRKSSGKKGQNHERRINPTQIQTKTEWPGSPVFALGNNDDFPTLGASPSTSTPSQSNELKPTGNFPSGAKIITASRRITPTSLSNPQSEPSRRITPTLVSNVTPTGASAFKTVNKSNREVLPSPNSAFNVIEKPSPATSPGDEHKPSLDSKSGPLMVLEEERQLLREAKSQIPEEAATPKAKGKIVSVVDITPSKLDTITPTKALRMTLERMPSITDNVKPQRSEVTHEDSLNVLVEIYAGCLQDNLVPNLMIELYFIMQLLTVRGGDFESLADISPDLDEINYLGNVHNTVYFAVKVLATQKRLLTLLDKGTMKLLVENCRIREFQPGLVEQFMEILEHCQSKRLSMFPPSPVGGVSFQADTDNRKNFPNDRSFQLFKKQRDQFYELLRDWEENHLTSGWSMSEALGDRIRSLVSSRIDMANHIHFSRLFQSQLIQMCKGDNSFKQEGDDDSISLLSQLKQSNPQKFKMLQERFIAPSTAGSPCPPPSFPGCQEFFRDFILAASCHLFYQHLTTSMAAKISELNGIQIIAPESDIDVDPIELQPERQQLTTCLLTLRLLGKFLGFVTFLPYQSPEKLPDSMQATYIAVRNKLVPCIDLTEYLITALDNGTMVLTVPWVAEYLSQMDNLAAYLETYQLVFALLLQIYRQTSEKFALKESASFSCALILLTLGWLFEQSVFPEGLFFTESQSEPKEVTLPAACLDRVDLVDHNLLYSCCSYLGEVKSLLLGFALGASHRGSSIRKITPLTTETPSSVAVCDKQLQNQLEDNFFHNHPASLKRTVDFVGDRIASNYIKKFRAHTLPTLLQRGSSRVREVVRNLNEDPIDSRTKKKALTELEEAALKYSQDTGTQANLEALGYTENKSQVILPLLLPEEGCCQVVTMATQICCRIARDKINTWMATHINRSMLQKEMTTEFEKLIKQPLHIRCRPRSVQPAAAVADVQAPSVVKQVPPPVSGTSNDMTSSVSELQDLHDECPHSPSDVIIQLKELMYNLYVKRDECCQGQITEALDNIQHLLTKRQDVVLAAHKTLGRMTVDLAALLASSHVTLWGSDIKDKLLLLWKQELKPHVGFGNVISGKHVYGIQSSPDTEICWQNFKEFVTMLTDEKILSKVVIADSIMILLKMNLPKDIVGHLADILCSTIERENEQEVMGDDLPPDGPNADYKQAKELDILLQTLDWLSQLSGNDSSLCCERLRSCRVVVRGTQIMLNQSAEEDLENVTSAPKTEESKTVILTQDQNIEMNKDTDVQKSDSGEMKRINLDGKWDRKDSPTECKTMQNNNVSAHDRITDTIRPET